MLDEDYSDKRNRTWIMLLLLLLMFIFVIALYLWGYPQYNVWAKELNGKALLKEAEWSRQIAIAEAQALKESASLKADAEVIRSRGIAEANEIIAGSITEEYIRYKFIEGLNDGNTEVIYVPTEANLPLLEARDRRIPS